MNKPFFSIVIPTFNRAKSLRLLLENIYQQSFSDFEIIIQDNDSTDNTRDLVYKYNKKHNNIYYRKNESNIRTARNLYKGILRARGKYIFMMGDDDLILKKDTLFNIYKILKNKEIGFIRLKFIYHNDFSYLFTYFANKGKEDIYFQKKSQNLEIYNFLYKYFQFISGVIFKNIRNKRIELLEKNNNSLYMDSFYIHYLFNLTKKYGAMVMNNEIIIATWSPKKNSTDYYDFVDNKAYFEEMWKFIKPNLSSREMNIWRKKEVIANLYNLPSIKYYSNNKNLLMTFRRILKLDKTLAYNFFTYVIFVFAFLCPKIIWETIRGFVYRANSVKDTLLLSRFNELLSELNIKKEQ